MSKQTIFWTEFNKEDLFDVFVKTVVPLPVTADFKKGSFLYPPKPESYSYMADPFDVSNQIAADEQMLKVLCLYLKRHSISKCIDDKQLLKV